MKNITARRSCFDVTAVNLKNVNNIKNVLQFCEFLLFCLQIFGLTAIKLAFYLNQINDRFGSFRQMGTLLVHWSASRPSVQKVTDRSRVPQGTVPKGTVPQGPIKALLVRHVQ